ncbi:hypothetical protein [Natrinema sp. JCM 9743]
MTRRGRETLNRYPRGIDGVLRPESNSSETESDTFARRFISAPDVA